MNQAKRECKWNEKSFPYSCVPFALIGCSIVSCSYCICVRFCVCKHYLYVIVGWKRIDTPFSSILSLENQRVNVTRTNYLGQLSFRGFPLLSPFVSCSMFHKPFFLIMMDSCTRWCTLSFHHPRYMISTLFYFISINSSYYQVSLMINSKSIFLKKFL